MARFSTTLSTPLSAEQAFAFMADVTNFASWDPGVERAVLVQGDGRALGSAWDLTVRAGGATVMRYVLTAADAPRRVQLEARTAFLTSVDVIRVDPDGAGAKVTYDAQLTLNGPLRLFDPALAFAFRRIGRRAEAGLRRALRG